MDESQDDQLTEFTEFTQRYFDKLLAAKNQMPINQIAVLSALILDVWNTGRQLFIFGNGGSAGNAIHLANDFLYGVSI